MGKHEHLHDADMAEKLTKSNTHIGLALSGGGIRATVFHLGVLARLACDDLLENVKFLSTVSGGSLAIGLIYARNSLAWPSSRDYLEKIVPRARLILTTVPTQRSYISRSIMLPWRLLQGRAHVLAGILENRWGLNGNLQELPATPRWFINATCYETGKNWRFSQRRMGDYETAYVIFPKFPIADAVASSAAVPGLIGPLVLGAKAYQWKAYHDGKLVPVTPKADQYDLWDGGVYENLGTEALYKPSGGLRDGVEFLVVSDASASLSFSSRGWKRLMQPIRRTRRLVDIATDQVRALRARTLIAEFARNPGSGVYLRMGNTCKRIYEECGQKAPPGEVLDATEVRKAASMVTTLRRLTPAEFGRLYRHGFEVADATLCSRQSGSFSPRSFVNSNGEGHSVWK